GVAAAAGGEGAIGGAPAPPRPGAGKPAGGWVGGPRRDTATQRAPIELALLGCRVLLDPRHKEVVQLVTGDLDPRVILRHLHYFFIPVATWPAQTIDLGDGHPLRPRYLYNATSPYAVLIREV